MKGNAANSSLVFSFSSLRVDISRYGMGMGSIPDTLSIRPIASSSNNSRYFAPSLFSKVSTALSLKTIPQPEIKSLSMAFGPAYTYWPLEIQDVS
jgi:hypothetical protein